MFRPWSVTVVTVVLLTADVVVVAGRAVGAGAHSGADLLLMLLMSLMLVVPVVLPVKAVEGAPELQTPNA